MKRRMFSSIRSQVWLIFFSSILIVLALWGAFYRTSSSLISDKTVSFVATLQQQSAENIERAADEMVYAANTVVTNKTVQSFLLSDEPLQRLEYGATLSNFMLGLMQYSNYVAHINIVGLRSSIISPSQQNINVIDRLDERYQAFDEDVYFTGYSGRIYNTYDASYYFTYTCPIYDTSSGAKLRTKIGTCVVFCNVNTLNRFLAQSVATENAVFLLLDDALQTVASSSDDIRIRETLVEYIDTQSDGMAENTTTLSIDRTNYVVSQQHIEGIGWRLISAVPVSEIANDLEPLTLIGTIACAMFALLSLLWSFHISHGITTPLLALTDFIDNDLDENLSKRIPIMRDNEIGMLCEQFNTMLDKVSDMTNEIISNQANMYELNLAKRRAELSALQSQINPHFLYNTLDCIKGYGYVANCDEIVRIANSMTSIMRYCIKGTDFVRLRDELGIVRNYLEIISIRFEGRFTYVFDICDDLLDTSIPRFILQPLIENAVYHGLEPKLSGGEIRITCRRDMDDLLISVADDGVGMSKEAQESLRAHILSMEPYHMLTGDQEKGLALINIHRRIRGIYGMAYGLNVEGIPGEGTEVHLRIPYGEYSPS